MFSGTFSGSAAQALNQSLLEWQRLWLAEEEMEKDANAERERQELEQQRLQWQKEAEAARLDAQNDADAAARLATIQDNQFKYFQQLESPSLKIKMAQGLDNDHPYKQEMLNSVSDEIFSNVTHALEYVDTYLNNAEIGVVPDLFILESAAKSIANYRGLEGKERQDLIDLYLSKGEELINKGEIVRDARTQAELDRAEREGLENRRTEGQIELDAAQTEQIKTNTALLEAEGLREEDRHIWAGERHQAEMLKMQQEYAQNEKINPLIVQGLTYDNDGKLLDLEIRNATKNATIKSILDQAALVGVERELKEIELHYAWENAELDIALKTNERDHITATIDSIRQNIKESEARITSLGINDELALSQLDEQRIATFTKLMGSGHVDLARKYADEFIGDIVGHEGMENILDNMAARAERQLDTETMELEAAYDIAFWQSVHAEKNAESDMRARAAAADNAEVQAQYAADVITSQIEANNANIRASDANVALQNARVTEILTGGGGGDGTPANIPTSLLEFMDDNRLTMGWTFEKIADLKTEYDVTDASIKHEESLFYQLAEGTPEQRNAAAQELASLYGMEPRYFNNPDNVAQLHAQKQAEWTSSREMAAAPLTNALTILFNNAFPLGVDMNPQAFGIDPNAPYWQAALLRNPAIRSASEAEAAALSQAANEAMPDMYARLEIFSSSNSPELIATVGPSVVWDAMSQEYGEDVVAEVFGSPAQLQEQMLEMSRDFTVPFDAVVPYFTERGYDMYDPVDRHNALQEMSYTLDRANTLLNQLRDGGAPGTKPPGVNTAFREIMDMLGQPVAPWQVSMMGRGDMINALTPAIKELNSLTQSLLHVDTRIPMGPAVNPNPGGE